MSSDVTVTLAGFVGTSPRLFTSESGTDYTSFRVAHTQRYHDRARGEWVDGRTTWFTVKAWRGVARNVASSLRKGDPVVVTGRLSLDEWTGPEGPRTTLVVEASALGPDLSRGEASFRPTVHRREELGPSEGPAAADASTSSPAAAEDPWEVPSPSEGEVAQPEAAVGA
jgi:single-strand DNA-binding protein